MKVSNTQKASDTQDSVSRDTSSKRQREGSCKQSKEDTSHKHGDSKDAGKQAEG